MPHLGVADISDSGMSEVGMIPKLRTPYSYSASHVGCGLWRRRWVGRRPLSHRPKSLHSKKCRLGN